MNIATVQRTIGIVLTVVSVSPVLDAVAVTVREADVQPSDPVVVVNGQWAAPFGSHKATLSAAADGARYKTKSMVKPLFIPWSAVDSREWRDQDASLVVYWDNTRLTPPQTGGARERTTSFQLSDPAKDQSGLMAVLRKYLPGKEKR